MFVRHLFSDRLVQGYTNITGKCKQPLNSTFGNSRDLDRFKDQLYHFLNSNYTNSDYQDDRLSIDMGLSRFQLFMKCLWYMGKSPTAILDSFRLTKMHELLEEGIYTVSEAVYVSGFKSFWYFSQCYRKKYHRFPFRPTKTVKGTLLNHSVFLLSLFWLSTFGPSTVMAQQATGRPKIYKVWVKHIDNNTRSVGALYKVNDGGLQISNSMKLASYILNDFQYIDVFAQDIEKIKLRKKGNIGRGILIGAISGLVTGAVIGLLEGDDKCESSTGWGSFFCNAFAMTVEEKALGYGTFLGLSGGFIGGLLGSLQIKIPVKATKKHSGPNEPVFNNSPITGERAGKI